MWATHAMRNRFSHQIGNRFNKKIIIVPMAPHRIVTTHGFSIHITDCVGEDSMSHFCICIKFIDCLCYVILLKPLNSGEKVEFGITISKA